MYTCKNCRLGEEFDTPYGMGIFCKLCTTAKMETDKCDKYISKPQVEEIKQPMTIIEAVEWMNEKPLVNKAKFNDKIYAIAENGIVFLIEKEKCSIYNSLFTSDIITGQWYKA